MRAEAPMPGIAASPPIMLSGHPMPLPPVIAPTGLNGLSRAGADRMLAEAAAEAGIPFTQSTMSIHGPDRDARAAARPAAA